MPIPFNCESCGRALNVRDELAGRQIYCPDCKSILAVPLYAPPDPEPDPDLALAAAAPAPQADELSIRAEEPAPAPPPSPPTPSMADLFDEDGDPVLRRAAPAQSTGPRIGAIIGGLALMGVSGLILIIQIAAGFHGALLKLMVILFIAGIVTFIKGLLGKTD